MLGACQQEKEPEPEPQLTGRWSGVDQEVQGTSNGGFTLNLHGPLDQWLIISATQYEECYQTTAGPACAAFAYQRTGKWLRLDNPAGHANPYRIVELTATRLVLKAPTSATDSTEFRYRR